MSNTSYQISEAINPHTSFDFPRMIQTEPLAIACIIALTNEGEPGSGLKLLRLVSKQFNIAMQQHIRGFTLTLDGVTEDLPDVIKMKLSQLVRLRVLLVTKDPNSILIGLSHNMQLQRFTTLAGSSLRTIRTLDLDLSHDRFPSLDKHSCYNITAVEVFGPLASTCTLLQHLRVCGDVGAPLLAMFAASCSQLSSLETVDLPLKTMEQLPMLFPQVSSTRMTLLLQNAHQEEPFYNKYELALSSCTTLKRLDIGGNALTARLWHALPPSVQELHIGFYFDDMAAEDEFPGEYASSIVPAGLQLPNLKEVVFQDPCLHVSQLAMLLHAAPNLQRLGTHNVWVPCDVDQFPHLELVNQRLAAGLVVSGSQKLHYQQGKHEEGLVLQLKSLGDTNPLSPSFQFLSGLPVLEHIVNIHVAMVQRFQAVHLARAFPQLKMLSVDTYEGHLFSRSIPCLGLFPLLETLALSAVYPVVELVALCFQIPSLQYLNAPLHSADRQAICDVLDAWGRDVVLSAF